MTPYAVPLQSVYPDKQNSCARSRMLFDTTRTEIKTTTDRAHKDIINRNTQPY